MNRRNFLLGLAAGLAPAVIRTPGLLMPVKRVILPMTFTFEMSWPEDPVDGVRLFSAAHPTLMRWVFGEIDADAIEAIEMEPARMIIRTSGLRLAHAPIVEG